MTEGRRTVISPAVERAAAERGISSAELAGMRGSGRGGRLLVSDLPEGGTTPRPATSSIVDERRVGTPAPTPPTAGSVVVGVTEERAAHIERAMRDARSAADLTSAVEVDVTALVRAVRSGAARPGDGGGAGPVVLPALVRALGRMLAVHPAMNARIDVEAGVVEYRDRVNLLLVSGGQGGDSAALIEDCAALSDEATDAALAGARLLARAGERASAEERRATFTLFDRSSSDVLFETVPLAEGTTGALSLGRVERRPLTVGDDGSGGDAFRVAWATYLCLTYDHRLVDGADAARFLSDLANELATPPSGAADA